MKSLVNSTHLSHFVSEVANLTPNERQPFVGRSVFAHKGGMHVDAVQKAGGRAYEHIDPQSVGNERRILVSELSGTSNVRGVAESFGINMEKGGKEATLVLQEVKKLEAEGYEFEGADASFQLLVRRTLGAQKEHLFDLRGVRIINEWRGKESDREWITEATLKIAVNGEIMHTVAEGDGPVHALDNALRLALSRFYPEMSEIRLTDFKVRVVNTREGTGAKVRVLIESANEETSWNTVGVSTNIIEASWQALNRSNRIRPDRGAGKQMKKLLLPLLLLVALPATAQDRATAFARFSLAEKSAATRDAEPTEKANAQRHTLGRAKQHIQ